MDQRNSIAPVADVIEGLTRVASEADSNELSRLRVLARQLISAISVRQNYFPADVEGFCRNPTSTSWQQLLEVIALVTREIDRIVKLLEREDGDFVFSLAYRDLLSGLSGRKRLFSEIESLGFPPSLEQLNQLRALGQDYDRLRVALTHSLDEIAKYAEVVKKKSAENPTTFAGDNAQQVVILVHGIRDFALWQNAVRTPLEDAGYIVELTNYGRMNLIEFVMPFAYWRKRAIETVWRQIRIIRKRYPTSPISVIAHSFGTFVIANVLKDNFDAKFDRVIFCGSVVPPLFSFENFSDRFRGSILNEVGTRDVWPAVAESITVGYGDAGTRGFRRALVVDRWHNGATHNFFLRPQFCERFWVPFLRNGTVVRASSDAESPRIWLTLISIFKLKYFVVGGFAWGALNYLLGGIPNFVFLKLLGVVKAFLKSNHKLAQCLFPVLNGHGPFLGDVA